MTDAAPADTLDIPWRAAPVTSPEATMRHRHAPLALLLFCAATPLLAAEPAADLVVHHARIWTGSHSPEATAMAVTGGRLVAVGNDTAVAGLIGPKTVLVEGKDRRIVPGFNDAHVHFSDGGGSLVAVQLNDARTPEELVRRLAEKAAHMVSGQWILAGEWDETKWPGAQLPTQIGRAHV